MFSNKTMFNLTFRQLMASTMLSFVFLWLCSILFAMALREYFPTVYKSNLCFITILALSCASALTANKMALHFYAKRKNLFMVDRKKHINQIFLKEGFFKIILFWIPCHFLLLTASSYSFDYIANVKTFEPFDGIILSTLFVASLFLLQFLEALHESKKSVSQ